MKYDSCRFTGNWQTLEYNMVPTKYFQQLLKDLGNPQPHAVRSQHHWRAPILSPSTRKVTYRFFDLSEIKHALEKQNIISLKERVKWDGDSQRTEEYEEADPMQALLAARSKAHGNAPKTRITCISNLVVGYGEGRATREVDLIWWPNLYSAAHLGKMCIRLYVSRVQLV